MKKIQKTRGTPKRRPKAKPAPTPAPKGTSIIKRPDGALAGRIELLPPAGSEERVITDGIALGALGLVELKLTDAEEKVLSEPAPIAEIMVKPTGQPYLSHPSYTRWFNRAFGRTGWSLVPVGKAAISGKSVVCPYVLHVHGQPVALAWGEQEYHENNRDQTYGDALESTVASALRRCAKRLGVGLELWDRDFLNRWLYENALRVVVDVRGDRREQWRRKNDRPLRGEQHVAGEGEHYENRHEFRGGERGGKQERQASTAPPREEQHTHRDSGAPISEKQAQRLWVIIRNSGRDEQQVKEWLHRVYGLDSTKKIPRSSYDRICQAVEDPGDLPERRG